MTDAETRTAPEPPRAAVDYFGGALPVARRYAELLAGAGTQRGLLGPREVPRLWERHLLNCAVVQEAVPPGVSVADVGSGAGLPGIVIALLRADVSMTLVEPLLRRSRFLDEVVSDLGLGNVKVVRARAEELHGELTVDVAIARAVAPLDKLARWCLPLLRPGGTLLALKGESAAVELARTRAAVVRAGAGEVSLKEYGRGIVEPATRVVVVERGGDIGQSGSGRRRRK